MPGFYYFLRGETRAALVNGDTIRPGAFESLGLDAIADRVRWPDEVWVNDVPGPGPVHGEPGAVVYAPGPDSDGQEPAGVAGQVWRDYGGLILGWFEGDPPAPRDLVRPELVDGIEIVDAYGRIWWVPIARSPMADYGTLPQFFRYDAAGGSRGEVKPEFVGLWETAGEVWDYYNYAAWRANQLAGVEGPRRPDDLPADDDNAEPPGGNRDFDWLRQVALRVIAVNYRLTWREANALLDAGVGLFDGLRVHAICRALIHFEFVEEVKKKPTTDDGRAASPTCDSTPGDGDDCPDTGPASES